jgi:predicted TIM-barrel fold metal-dependent hydrolase
MISKNRTQVRQSLGHIDAHVHLWSSDTKRYPMVAGTLVEEIRPRQFLADDLFQQIQANGVERVVLVQMSYYGCDHSLLLDTLAEFPEVFAGIGVVDHHSSAVIQDIHRLASQKIRGFRLNAKEENSSAWPDDSGMRQLWKECGRLGMAVCPLVNLSDLPAIAKLCGDFPDTTVVIDHMARLGIGTSATPEEVLQLCKLARFPAVHVKLSAFYAMGIAPLYRSVLPTIERLVKAFGATRLMWGSDAPYQIEAGHDYKSSHDLIQLGCHFLTESEKRAIMRETADRIFYS